MSKTIKYVLAINYMILGIATFMNQNLPAFDSFPSWAKMAFPILLIAYGAFRLYRTYVNLEDNSEQ
jgi:uncharacterized membrane protein YjfL (UPF0719 family)